MKSNVSRAPARRRIGAPQMAALSLCCMLSSAWAAPVSIATPFMNLENRAVNSLGFGPGQFVRWGANAVTPNGNAGTTGLAIQTGTGVTRTINFNPGPSIPNFFSRYVADQPALRGDWTLRFTNGADVATAQVSLSAEARQAPFVNSITLAGDSVHPEFRWTPPPGVTVNGYRVNIYDRSLISNTNNGQVASRNLPPTETSYLVKDSDFTVPGFGFQLGKNYAIEISLIQTKDGTSNNLGNANLQAISRVYADFTPNNGGGPPVNLPVVLEDGSYQFNMSVVPGQTYYIDPEIAIGYDYAIGAGDPNFASVTLPGNIGDGLFDIYGYDVTDALALLVKDWRAGDVFSFGTDGVDRFRVLGIETDAGLDPANTTAFVTGLTFTGSGQFTGTQTPITVTIDVPEPPALALVGMALLGLGLARRGRRLR